MGGGQDNEKFIKFKLGSGPTKTSGGAGQRGGQDNENYGIYLYLILECINSISILNSIPKSTQYIEKIIYVIYKS